MATQMLLQQQIVSQQAPQFIGSNSLWQDFDQLNDGVVDPPSNCCYFYNGTNFGGDRKTYCHYGDERQVSLRHADWDFDNKMESWYCGSASAVRFCAMDFGEDGECEEDRWNAKLSSGAGNIQNKTFGYWSGLKNGVSSVKIMPYNVVTGGAVTLFDENDCTGESSMFQWNGEDSYYSAADLDLVGIKQNRASSVMIPEGYEITLYNEDNREGLAETLYGGFLP